MFFKPGGLQCINVKKKKKKKKKRLIVASPEFDSDFRALSPDFELV